MSEEGEEKLKMIIQKVSKLGWIQTINGEPYMHLADVEKTILALFDDFEMWRIDSWANAMPKPEKLPELKIPELERLRRISDNQAMLLRSMFKKEACLLKVCPFPNVPREERK